MPNPQIGVEAFQTTRWLARMHCEIDEAGACVVLDFMDGSQDRVRLSEAGRAAWEARKWAFRDQTNAGTQTATIPNTKTQTEPEGK